MDVAEATASAPGHHDLLADRDEVGDQAARAHVDDGRAGRYREIQVLARLAVLALALARTARRGGEVVLVAEVMERGLAGIDSQVDRAAAPAVAPIGTTTRDMGLTAHGGCAITARAGAHPDFGHRRETSA